jgi:hypothetical protein
MTAFVRKFRPKFHHTAVKHPFSFVKGGNARLKHRKSTRCTWQKVHLTEKEHKTAQPLALTGKFRAIRLPFSN